MLCVVLKWEQRKDPVPIMWLDQNFVRTSKVLTESILEQKLIEVKSELVKGKYTLSIFQPVISYLSIIMKIMILILKKENAFGQGF